MFASLGLPLGSNAFTSYSAMNAPAYRQPTHTQRQTKPIEKRHPKTLVLDLDETLIYSSPVPLPGLPTLVEFDGLFVYKRPQVDDFLDAVAKLFDVFIFTSSEKPYADRILNALRPSIDENHRFYWTSVDEVNGKLRKDLSLFNRGLNKVILVDDNAVYWSFFPGNTILIPSWKGDQSDFMLMCSVYPILEKCNTATDVRSVISKLEQARRD
jgi:CTD small phosphatase-like protein 2